MPHVVLPSVLQKDDDGMPHLTLSFRVCSLKAMILCHIDVVLLCVLSKGDTVRTSLTSSDNILSKGEIVCHA